MSPANTSSLGRDAGLECLQDSLLDSLQKVETLLHEDANAFPLIGSVSKYILDSGGKRIRPMLVLLIARYFGELTRQHLSLAAAVESLHTASLLHDDVLDDATVRRGRASVNRRWGNITSVLMGDYFHTKTLRLLVKLEQPEVLNIISKATTCLIEGEIMQFDSKNNWAAGEPQYLDIIRKKTGVLFQAAAQAAAVVAEASIDIETSLKKFGMHFGLGYQLVDDLLDYTGLPGQLGKTTGNDLAEGKVTLPLIYALSQNKIDRSRLAEAVNTQDEEELAHAVKAVRDSGGLEYTRNMIKREREKARDCLNELVSNDSRSKLAELSDFALMRSI